jgi:hypothetical protein
MDGGFSDVLGLCPVIAAVWLAGGDYATWNVHRCGTYGFHGSRVDRNVKGYSNVWIFCDES